MALCTHTPFVNTERPLAIHKHNSTIQDGFDICVGFCVRLASCIMCTSIVRERKFARCANRAQ